MRQRIHIAIIEPSLIIRTGFSSILKRIPSLDIEIAYINDVKSISVGFSIQNIDLIIVNPSFSGFLTVQQLKNQVGCTNAKAIALKTSMVDPELLKSFDQIIDIYDSQEQIENKLFAITQSKEQKDNNSNLSKREKDIIICIVNGLSNKEIAQQLYISTHTVMAHRRNIANKLKIHSTAGLTIFAIVNKLVSIE